MSTAIPEVYEDDAHPVTAIAIREEVRTLLVFDQPSLTYANGWLRKIKEMRSWCETKFGGPIHDADVLHKKLVAQKREWTDQLDEAEKALKPKIAAYLVEEDRKRFEAQRAAQRAKEAIEKEANDATDVAHDLIKNGELDEAEAIVDMTAKKIEEIQATTPSVPEKAVAEGASLRTIWDFEIENEALIPRQYLMPDMVKIRGYVRAMKDQGAIAGIRIFSTKTIASKGR